VKTGREVQLTEVGPRFEMKRRLRSRKISHFFDILSNKAYEIRQGTLEQTAAEREWVLTHYTRTAKKRTALSEARFPESTPAKKAKS
jgi:U3 small nucleolar ribonucleoprotein protein IMP4